MNHRHSLPPADAPACTFCQSKGFHRWEGEWSFCRCRAGQLEREKDPKAADLMNRAYERMEQRAK